MWQKSLIEVLYDFRYAAETLKQLPPVLNMMQEQFTQDWDNERIDRLCWLIEQLQGDITLSIDLLENPINRLIQNAESGSLSQGEQSHD